MAPPPAATSFNANSNLRFGPLAEGDFPGLRQRLVDDDGVALVLGAAGKVASKPGSAELGGKPFSLGAAAITSSSVAPRSTSRPSAWGCQRTFIFTLAPRRGPCGISLECGSLRPRWVS